MKLKKIITITAVAVISVLLIYGFILISQIFSANTKFEEKEVYVHVPSGANYSDVKEILAPYIKKFDNFELVLSPIISLLLDIWSMIAINTGAVIPYNMAV